MQIMFHLQLTTPCCYSSYRR